MKIQFYLRFSTRFGQTLSVCGNTAVLGDNDTTKAFPLQYLNDEFWQGTVEIDPGQTEPLQYFYILHTAEGRAIEEWGNDRIVDMSKKGLEEVLVIDTWNHAGDPENAFYTAPFAGVLLKENQTVVKPKVVKTFTHTFKVKAPLLKKGEAICIVGSNKPLGEWQTEVPVLLHPDGNWWQVKLNMAGETFPIAYKYGVYDTVNKQFRQFESGNNRVLYDAVNKKKMTILHDGFAQIPQGNWRGTGVAIPVFSLRSKNSFGTGEFTDIKLLVDWAKAAGMKLVQLLPINDTTAWHTTADSYPYAAISAFALHPLYLNLEKVAGKAGAAIITALRKKKKQLNDSTVVEYLEVMKFKRSALKEIYALQKDTVFAEEAYQQFFDANKHWLVPYAAFCYLRDKYKTPDFNGWKTHSSYDEAAITKLSSRSAKHFDEIGIHYFIQYHLHLQLQEATAYAHKNGIIVKGDIAIGVGRYGCDTWVAPELYNMDMQAGAPPDDFAVKGQNWSFPTYNWKRMQEDGFAWWKQRFEQMSYYFDAFRIDHILGFFRIWSIPLHAVEGIMGHFVPAIPVHISEFHQRGISFDRDRYCQPWINDSVLWEVFSHDADSIKEHYLDALADGKYSLKPAFATQRLVEAHFAALKDTPENQRLREGLYDLISNVILFEVADSQGQQYHFRLGMENTTSFRHLDWNWQNSLKELAVDYFYKRQDASWMEEALHKLPALKKATNMLVCGEDLGMVPACVPEVMAQLGMLSLEIQRMPKKTGIEFFHPADAPYLSVVTPSTHDMSTIRSWWEEDRGRTQRFYNYVMGQAGDAPFYCEEWISRAIVLQHLYSPAMWSIFQLQDIMGLSAAIRRENPAEERINNPANPKHYWQYRMHISLEALLKEKELITELKTAILQSGRVGNG